MDIPQEELEQLEKASLVFWKEPLNVSGQPYKSLRKYQILKQLRKQFGLNLEEWEFISNSQEGHLLPAKGRAQGDWVENYSGEIFNKKTGKRLSFWGDWISKCEETEGSWKTCPHDSPDRCGIKFYVDCLGDTWYDPDGNPTPEPFKSEREKRLLSPFWK